MILINHLLCEYIRINGNLNKLQEETPYLLYPDALKKYFSREATHFVINDNKVSYLKYPNDLNEIESIEYYDYGLNENKLIGYTDYDLFNEINRDLPYYDLIKLHLIQDTIYSDYLYQIIIKKQIDNKETFFYDNQKYVMFDFKPMLYYYDQIGTLYLSYLIYSMYGITTNQEWFEKNIYPTLKGKYPKELLDLSYNYLKIPKLYNEMITKHDYSYFNTIGDFDKFINMYISIIRDTRNFDVEKPKVLKK